jgi:quercetin dioxygenase-like cupin family protein
MPPIIRHLADQEWEGWPSEQVAERGRVSWKELLGDPFDAAQGADMVMGVARLKAGEHLALHRHAQPETYFVLAGRGVVTIDGVARKVDAGTLVFIPGDAEHGIRNDGAEELQFLYAFATGNFSQINYRF